MYFRIYKALNVLLWMIPAEKKVLERWWSTRIFIKFVVMSVLLKDCFCLTLINIHHCLYKYYIHICYKYCLNE